MRATPDCLATCCIPWRADWSFDEDLFRRQVRHVLAGGITHQYIFGTAGEGYAVTDSQFARIAAVFLDEMRAGGGQPQLGVIGLSVPQIAARIETGLALGYGAFQISFPCWGTLNDREMYGFFDAVLGGYPTAQFLHYNLRRGGRLVTAREYARVGADHPNLVATKAAGVSAAESLALVLETPDICHYFTELGFAYASLFGPCGLLMSYSCLQPARAHELFSAGQARDADTLTRMTLELRRVLQTVISVVASGQHMDGAYDKLYVKMALPDFPLRLLPPYLGATDEEFAAFRERLHADFPHWLP